MIGEVLNPKLWGGDPCTPVRQRFNPRSETEDVSRPPSALGRCIDRRPPTLLSWFSPETVAGKNAALCCHARICRFPFQVTMLPEVLPERWRWPSLAMARIPVP